MTGLLASLAGTWLIERSIDDGSSMTGTATFAPCGAEQFDYREQGQFRRRDGRMFDAERRYIFEETGGGFTVFFSEISLRPFHRVVLCREGSSLVGAATHRCADDRYDSRYEFRADGSFTIEHRVCGPRKGYVMETRYVRALV
ncbi:MAG: DUF6314 family protein [Stellaceae bacterium]